MENTAATFFSSSCCALVKSPMRHNSCHLLLKIFWRIDHMEIDIYFGTWRGTAVKLVP